ncbi:MAG: hypothetical protein LBH95_09930 [Oscillospiraceae bacterium]|jgi:hypothetical protein|nr:hypothetical protein [Oscillospiraceae bacterium]
MHYKNFINATYAPAAYLKETSLEQMAADIKKAARYIKLDKIYLETYRSDVLVERDKMEAAKKLFSENGYVIAGGITTTENGPLMGSMCYTNPETRKKLGEIAAYTAELFDTIILDDFYFTNCRCESCIKAKGDRDWAAFRLALMNDISENVIIKSAKEANPNAHVIIKYPNWYESFPACGYNLEDEPKMFASIYTGTETRDPHYTHQNLQRYLSYFLPRLAERIKPGLNGGGWYDLFECDLDDYVQQAYLTLFAKCRENMLFCFPLMLRFPAAYMAAAGAFYDEADLFMGELGEPTGVACYKPYHSHGERHLYDLLGMLGIPLDPYPEYPSAAKTVLLTASAAWDGGIVDKIKGSLLAGSRVFVTSGLYDMLRDRGIRDILPMEVTEKKAVSDDFSYNGYAQGANAFVKAAGPVTLPHIAYGTNDLWVLASALTPYESHPLLLRGAYGKSWLYVLNIPDLPADLYKLPAGVLTLLRGEMDLPVTLESGARVGLFLYDNDTFIIQSFLERPERVRVRVGRSGVTLEPLTMAKAEPARSGEGESVFEVPLMPGWYGVFKVKG